VRSVHIIAHCLRALGANCCTTKPSGKILAVAPKLERLKLQPPAGFDSIMSLIAQRPCSLPPNDAALSG